MEAVIQGVERNDAGYSVFNFSSHAIAIVVMLPVTFCAGMTLPLNTNILLKGGVGERSIGHVYTANTLGAICGVALAVHLLLPYVGLKALICVGAGVDLLAGVVLLARHSSFRHVFSWGAVSSAALLGVVVFVQLDACKMFSGVFRYGEIDLVEGARIALHEDGKTDTVSLVEFDNGITAILTNGKTDASMQLQPGGTVSSDQLTMAMARARARARALAAVPYAKFAAVVGIGAGMSTHVLLGSSELERVDSIEIEPKMVQAARVFAARIPRAFEDPRGRIHYEDARTFFSTQRQRYDLILSEPSNHSVSGIATLFTREFYDRARRSLSDDGRFVQWIHGYEISLPLIATIVNALGESFDDYAL